MKQSPGRQNTPRPYWEPKSDTVYSELAFGLEWLASVWRAEVRCVEDHWSPDLAGLADEWASWHEEVELRAVMEAELAEYQQQMEAAYVRRLYEEQEALERRRQQWSPVNDGARW